MGGGWSSRIVCFCVSVFLCVCYHSANPEKKKAASKASYSADNQTKKAASKACYSAEPEKKKAASKASYNADPEKKKAASKASYSAHPQAKKAAAKTRYFNSPEKKKAASRAYSKRKYAKNPTEKISPHKHTMQTTKKAGVLTEEPGMCWLSQSVMYKNSTSRKYSVIC